MIGSVASAKSVSGPPRPREDLKLLNALPLFADGVGSEGDGEVARKSDSGFAFFRLAMASSRSETSAREAFVLGINAARGLRKCSNSGRTTSAMLSLYPLLSRRSAMVEMISDIE